MEGNWHHSVWTKILHFSYCLLNKVLSCLLCFSFSFYTSYVSLRSFLSILVYWNSFYHEWMFNFTWCSLVLKVIIIRVFFFYSLMWWIVSIDFPMWDNIELIVVNIVFLGNKFIAASKTANVFALMELHSSVSLGKKIVIKIWTPGCSTKYHILVFRKRHTYQSPICHNTKKVSANQLKLKQKGKILHMYMNTTLC